MNQSQIQVGELVGLRLAETIFLATIFFVRFLMPRFPARHPFGAFAAVRKLATYLRINQNGGAANLEFATGFDYPIRFATLKAPAA